MGLAILMLCMGLATSAGAQHRPADGGDVLLTFDTEFEDDAAALIGMNLDIPATYFWTGAYARLYPDLLRSLAEQGHTIGSHSFHHDDLTTINARQVQLDLEMAKMVIEEISGVAVTSFRAPYLEYNEVVSAEVARLGFRVDSSDKSPWPRNPHLPEIAVSEFENLLVSDYDIFSGRGLDDATALDFLIRAYSHHAQRGQPLVVLLHPRIIGRHADVLHDFIAHVETGGGRFLTMDGFLARAMHSQGPPRIAIWAEIGSDGNVAGVLQDATWYRATDVILSLPEPATALSRGATVISAGVAVIQARGIRVHLALPVTHNPQLAAVMPTTVMTDMGGQQSRDWVSPSHPDVRRQLVVTAGRLVSDLGVDGLHLYGVGYPGLAWDFSPAALLRFSAASGISGVTPEDILTFHHMSWTQWRAKELAQLLADIAVSARSTRADIIVSASLLSDAATDYRRIEETGQDLRLLGDVVDLIVPWMPVSFGTNDGDVARLLLATRTQVGNVPVLLGSDMRYDHRFYGGIDAPDADIPIPRAGTVVDVRGHIAPGLPTYETDLPLRLLVESLAKDTAP